jgi:hypothetical protein
MTEEAFLRYRKAVVEQMPDSPYKRALLTAIHTRMAESGCSIPNGSLAESSASTARE